MWKKKKNHSFSFILSKKKLFKRTFDNNERGALPLRPPPLNKGIPVHTCVGPKYSKSFINNAHIFRYKRKGEREGGGQGGMG